MSDSLSAGTTVYARQDIGTTTFGDVVPMGTPGRVGSHSFGKPNVVFTGFGILIAVDPALLALTLDEVTTRALAR